MRLWISFSLLICLMIFNGAGFSGKGLGTKKFPLGAGFEAVKSTANYRVWKHKKFKQSVISLSRTKRTASRQPASKKDLKISFALQLSLLGASDYKVLTSKQRRTRKQSMMIQIAKYKDQKSKNYRIYQLTTENRKYQKVWSYIVSDKTPLNEQRQVWKELYKTALR